MAYTVTETTEHGRRVFKLTGYGTVTTYTTDHGVLFRLYGPTVLGGIAMIRDAQ